MKFSQLILSALALVGSSCHAFQQPVVVKARRTVASSSTTCLGSTNQKNKHHEWWGPVMTAMAGLTLASQVASAAILVPAEKPLAAGAQHVSGEALKTFVCDDLSRCGMLRNHSC